MSGRFLRYVKRFVIAGMVCCVVPAAGAAEGDLEAGLARFDDLEYEAAIPLLERALASEALPPADRARAALHLGIIHVAFGDEDRARARIAEALRLDPEASLPGMASPHIREIFESARAELPAPAPPDDATPPAVEARRLLEHEPPPPGRERAIAQVRLDPARQIQIERVHFRHRLAGEAIWFEIAARAVDLHTFEAELPSPGSDGTPVEYYVEAFDRTGARVGQIGSAATPLVYAAPEAPVASPPGVVDGPPVYQRWWFLTGTGVAVAAGVAGGVILVSRSAGGRCTAPDGAGCLRLEVE